MTSLLILSRLLGATDFRIPAIGSLVYFTEAEKISEAIRISLICMVNTQGCGAGAATRSG
jgi:hypothetical protein